MSLRRLGDILGVPIVDKYQKYLGLPMVMGRYKREVFDGLKDRVWRKLQSWKSKRHSQAGQEFLIKSMIQAIPSYASKCCMDALPSVSNQRRRGVTVEAVCVMCGLVEEDMHVLMNCSYARLIEALSPVPSRITTRDSLSAEAWLRGVFR
ncbi:hypothetical protein Sango_0361900 [Sesamum angolense]|uniref:Reverse transcriptase zinc-binding domain-containing protein n=1 Tax=Sesamum angolense TaxID=2727404 RepID=A0AAE2C3L0_9LAMI|nr:hypothetical protein Sango_0361900 [Sesamum angolense]